MVIDLDIFADTDNWGAGCHTWGVGFYNFREGEGQGEGDAYTSGYGCGAGYGYTNGDGRSMSDLDCVTH
jgi:hypothetical protein